MLSCVRMRANARNCDEKKHQGKIVTTIIRERPIDQRSIFTILSGFFVVSKK